MRHTLIPKRRNIPRGIAVGKSTTFTIILTTFLVGFGGLINEAFDVYTIDYYYYYYYYRRKISNFLAIFFGLQACSIRDCFKMAAGLTNPCLCNNNSNLFWEANV